MDGLTTASVSDTLAVLHARPDKADPGEIARRMLERWVAPVVLIVDPAQQRVIGSADTVTQAALLDAWAEDTGVEVIVQPVAGQVGVPLLWEVVSDGWQDATFIDRLTNSYQRRSFYGLLNAGLNHYADLLQFPGVLVNQNTAHIHFKWVGVLSGLLDALTPGGETVCVEFVKRTPGTLVFE